MNKQLDIDYKFNMWAGSKRSMHLDEETSMQREARFDEWMKDLDPEVCIVFTFEELRE